MKSNLTIAGVMAGAMALTGCATTSGGQVASIQPVQPGDSQMTCEEVSAEIMEMNEILGIAEDDLRSLQAMGIAEDVAVNAALYSGAFAAAGSSMPFIGTAINAAGAIRSMNRAQKEQLAEQAVDRRNVLTGLYAGKNCGAS